MDKNSLKKVAYFIGKSLGFLGLLFVLYKLSQEYTFSSFTEQFSLLLEITPLLFILNFTSSLIGIYAWHMMLLHYAKQPFPYSTSYYYFAKTEISKYLPGNIFHFVGRQVLASKLGIDQKQMAKTSFFFFFLLLTGTVLSSTIFAFFAHSVDRYILTLLSLASAGSIITVLISYPSFPQSKKVTMNLLLAISIALQGIILSIIIMYQSDTFTLELFFLCASIYIVSWLIGFVTPGASGGVGIREGSFIAIVAFLHVDIASDIIIFSVLFIRLLNIFIDIMMYLSTLILKNKIQQLEI